jgi:hypothetical protein
MSNIIIPCRIPDDRRKLHEWKEKRLKAGLHLPDYKAVSLPSYWRTSKGALRQRKPTTYEEILRQSRPFECPWQFEKWDTNTGELYERFITHNLITDLGAMAMLKNTWNSAGSAVPIFNHVVISPNGCSTKLTVASGTSPITSLSVNALPAGLANGRQLTLGFNGATPQTITLNATANAGDTTLTVVSFTPSTNFPIGTDICAIPLYTDNPSSVSGSVDSGALSSGAFTYTPTTGLGNRQVQIQLTFTGTTGNVGTYTEAYTSNNGTIGSNTTGSHTIFAGFVLNSGSSETVTLVEKA